MPTVADMRAHLLAQDVVWVGGGSVANLLAVWRVHGLDEIFREVLGGRRRARRGLGRLAVLARRRHHRLLRARPAPGHQRPRAASRRPTASTTTPRSSAARCTTGSSPTAPCPAGTPPTTASGWSTAAPSWSRPWPTGRRRRLPGGARPGRHGGRDPAGAAPARLTGGLGWARERAADRARRPGALRGGLGAAARAARRPGRRRGARHPAAARAPVGLHGRASAPRPHERPFDGTPVIDVDRGGKITWHGPGQLVGYPIVALPDPVDVVAYVRRLEERADRGLRRLRAGHRPGRGPQRRVGRAPTTPRARAQGRRDRRPGGPRRDHARLRAQLRPRHDARSPT